MTIQIKILCCFEGIGTNSHFFQSCKNYNKDNRGNTYIYPRRQNSWNSYHQQSVFLEQMNQWNQSFLSSHYRNYHYQPWAQLYYNLGMKRKRSHLREMVRDEQRGRDPSLTVNDFKLNKSIIIQPLKQYYPKPLIEETPS